MSIEQLPRGLSEQVARFIGVRIIGGQLQSGSKIENEDLLCEEFGVSRTVIREAMKRLKAKGLVDIRPRIGTLIRQRQDWSLLDPDILDWCLETQPSIEVMLQLREMRGIIEPGGVALACARASDDSIDKIMEKYESMEKSVEDIDGFVIADTEFHIEILQATENDYLSALAGLIRTDLYQSIKVTNPDIEKNINSLQAHKDVAIAISNRDVFKAEKTMKMLLTDAGNRLKSALDDDLPLDNNRNNLSKPKIKVRRFK